MQPSFPLSRLLAASVSGLALLLSGPVAADTILAFQGAFGDGLVFSDPAEGIEPPGIKVLTGTPGTEFNSANGFSPNGVTNCVMANAPPELGCDAPEGSGKRYKTRLTGPLGLDLVYGTQGGTGTTEYFNFGKTTNLTGARITGLSLILGTGTGDGFVPVSPEGGVLFDELVTLVGRAAEYEGLDGQTTGQNPLQRFFLPDGLFGEGGQDGPLGTGFFSDGRAGFVAVPSEDLTRIDSAGLFNDDHLVLFGDALLDRSMIPEAIFWDDDSDPTNEAALVAWNSPAAGGWIWGNVDLDDPDTAEDETALRLDALAAALGLTAGDLGHTPGALLPEEVLAAAEASSLFTVDVIEDLSNLNLNFSFDIGDNPAGAFTLRILPLFAPVVTLAATELQFRVAGSLDAANIPYLAADPGYLAMIDQVLALPEAEGRADLERLGYSFLGAYGGIGTALGRDAVMALADAPLPGGAVPSTMGGAPRWSLGEGLEAFVSAGGSRTAVDPTANNAGYETQARSIWAGLETQLPGAASAGVMIGAASAETEIGDDRGSLDADGAGAAVFLRTTFGGTGRLQAIAGVQELDFDSRRVVAPASAVAEAATGGRLTFAAVEADWMMRRGAVAFGPMASLEHTRLRVDGFTETGAGIWNIEVAEHTASTTLASLGAKGEAALSGGAAAFGHLAWTTQSGDAGLVPTAFDGLPAMLTPVDAADEGWLDLGLGLSGSVLRRDGGVTRMGAEYRGAFAGSGQEGHALRLFVDVTF